MKTKIQKILSLLCIVVVLVAFAPAAYAADTESEDAQAVKPGTGTQFEGLDYIDVNSSLGSIRLYLPFGKSSDCLYVTGGRLYNMSDGVIYFYCPEFPTYTFSATRYEAVEYKTTNAYTEIELTSVVEVDRVSYPDDTSLIFVLLGVVLLVLFAVALMNWR